MFEMIILTIQFRRKEGEEKESCNNDDDAKERHNFGFLSLAAPTRREPLYVITIIWCARVGARQSPPCAIHISWMDRAAPSRKPTADHGIVPMMMMDRLSLSLSVTPAN